MSLIRYCVLVALMPVIFWLAGCGGGGTGDSITPDQTDAQVYDYKLIIQWPATGLLSQRPMCVKAVASVDHTNYAAQQIVNRPSATNEQTVVGFDDVPGQTPLFTLTAYAQENGAGPVIATATAYLTRDQNLGDGQTTARIVMGAPVATLKVTPAYAMLPVGSSKQFVSTAMGAAAEIVMQAPGSVQWTSSNASVVTVSGTGLATAKAPGTATITLKATGSAVTAAAVVDVGNAGLSGKIAYTQEDLEGQHTEVMNADGTHVVTNLPPRTQHEWSAVFNWQGTKLGVFYDNGEQFPSIDIVNMDNLASQNIAYSGLEHIQPVGLPSFSADGNILALSDDNTIYLMGVDGSNQRAVPGSEGFSPVLTVDGRILFVSKRSGIDEIYIMQADGSGVTQLTHGGGSEPAISHAGPSIAFTRNGQIFLMGLDGSSPKQLTTQGGGSATFSPDGKHIAFAAEANGVSQIFVIAVTGENLRRLTNTRLPAYAPSWGPVPYGSGAVVTIE